MLEWPLACIDLIYLDPPFNSNRQYNAIYKDETGRPLPDQIEAFCDMWELDDERERAIRTMPVLMRDSGIDDATVEMWRLGMRALRSTQPRLLAYLSYMAERLFTMWRLLKPTGSLYFHCDPTASHYIKLLLDSVFGLSKFRSEIVWRRTAAHNRARQWGPIHDTILYYTKSDKFTWHRVFQQYDQKHIDGYFRHEDEFGRYGLGTLTGPGTSQGSSGQPWRGVDPTEKGRHWEVPPDRILPPHFKHPPGYSEMNVQGRLDILDAAGLIYWPPRGDVPQPKQYLSMSPGVPVQDIIWDIPPVSGQAKERTGFATQKPVALMERIISVSSNPGDVVLDPFCGCATTMEAANRLGRQWIGIDIAIHVIKRVAQVRLVERMGLVEGQDFVIDGVPRTLEGAQDLWRRDKYHFQKWAVEQIGGFVTATKSADRGIDGRVYFAVPEEAELQSMLVEVKGGKNVNVMDWRALKAVLSKDSALMAGLIIMESLGEAKFRNFAREVMDLEPLGIHGIEYPRMQILTIDEILNGKRFKTPTVAGQIIPEPRFPGIPA